jgi:hypothetical protein
LKFLAILELWLNFNYLSYTIFPREKTWSSGYDLFFQPKGSRFNFFFIFFSFHENNWVKKKPLSKFFKLDALGRREFLGEETKY